MSALVRFVVATIRGLRWTLDLIVALATLCLLALFALQFPHPESVDRFWPVIQLETYGDPILAEAGSLMFAQEEGDPVPWPSEEIRYFPLLLVVGLVAIRLLFRAAFRPILRSGRKYLQTREPGEVSPRGRRSPLEKPEPEEQDPGEEGELPDGEATAETRPTPEAIQTADVAGDPETDSEGDAASLETIPFRSGVPESGGTIGRYVLEEELGRGAMGVVYKATDPKIGRPVAIKKILTGTLAPDELEEYLERFHQEARAAGQLSHRGIVAVHDLVEEDGESSLVMEYVEGMTLDELVERERLPLGRSLDIMLQVARALGYAHERGVVHRDMKPGNILVTPDEVAKITDFGIAKLVGSKLTRTGQIMGTPAYMSPEQFRDGAVGAWSDVFSLGSILYWLGTGESAFPGESLTTVAFKVVQTSPVPPRELNPALPKEIDLLISKAMAKAPETRYPHGNALADDLEAFRDGRRLSVEAEETDDT